MINADKPQRWNQDTRDSILQYNQWFLSYAPRAYQSVRQSSIARVHRFLEGTNYLIEGLKVDYLLSNPRDLSVARMLCAPPIARDRLAGLAQVNRTAVQAMEKDKEANSPISLQTRREAINNMLPILDRLLDRQLCPWINRGNRPNKNELEIAASVCGDRLCGSQSDPLVRNEQERRQLTKLDSYLESRGYSPVNNPAVLAFDMSPGTFSHHKNVRLNKNGQNSNDGFVNTPVDLVIMPYRRTTPVLIECKCAGDITNTNKRRKEEDTKVHQLIGTYGDTTLYLFLCGYFDSSYLGYEAANHMDWIWEHRISDLDELVPENE